MKINWSYFIRDIFPIGDNIKNTVRSLRSIEKTRPTEDEWYLGLCSGVATRSTCLRADVGSIITQFGIPVGFGYNGAPKNAKHCDEFPNGCPLDLEGHCMNSLHSEINAMFNSPNSAHQEGLRLYCTHQPCINCCKSLVNFGIKRVIYNILGSRIDDRVNILGFSNQNEYLNSLGIEVVSISTPLTFQLKFP